MLYQTSSKGNDILFQKVIFMWKFKKQTTPLVCKPFFYKVTNHNSHGSLKLIGTKINIFIRYSQYVQILKKFNNYLALIDFINFNFLFLSIIKLSLLRIDNICRLSKLKTIETLSESSTLILTKNYMHLIKLI